ncbi:UNVERIFIED_CONTAM: hypothetical protein K2H54_046942 [Gekko kuhli]
MVRLAAELLLLLGLLLLTLHITVLRSSPPGDAAPPDPAAAPGNRSQRPQDCSIYGKISVLEESNDKLRRSVLVMNSVVMMSLSLSSRVCLCERLLSSHRWLMPG